MNNKTQKENELQVILERNLNQAAVNRVQQLITNLRRIPNHNRNLLREAIRRANNYNIAQISNMNLNNNGGPFWNSIGNVINYPRNRIGNNGIEPFTQNSYRNNTRYVQVTSNGKNYYFNRNQFLKWVQSSPNHNFNPLTRTPLTLNNLKMVRFRNVPRN
jgi:hypothetical protein